tara:strand:+ start:6840 stop:7079 length:240 start_codon:yes stop_codon:yes gene_type:complete
MKKFLALLLFCTACGDGTLIVKTQVEGEVIVKHQIDVLAFEEYYRTYCETLYKTESLVQKCVDDQMAAFVKSLTENGLL